MTMSRSTILVERRNNAEITVEPEGERQTEKKP
jgi:hypothetical protein